MKSNKLESNNLYDHENAYDCPAESLEDKWITKFLSYNFYYWITS